MKTPWEEEALLEHRALSSHMEMMHLALDENLPPHSRWRVLSWSIRDMWPAVELHLQKEEIALFPALRRCFGETAAAVLKQEHNALRCSLRRLAKMIQNPEMLDWDQIPFAVNVLGLTLESHAREDKKMALDPLDSRLSRSELLTLGEGFREPGEQAFQAGWAPPWWEASRQPLLV